MKTQIFKFRMILATVVMVVMGGWIYSFLTPSPHSILHDVRNRAAGPMKEIPPFNQNSPSSNTEWAFQTSTASNTSTPSTSPSVADLDSLARRYSHRPRQELKKDFTASVASTQKLIEKANLGSMTEQERALLTLEIRRQAVINNLLLESKLEIMKRKYL